MRGIGQVLLVVGSAVDAVYLVPIGLANVLVTGDLMPAPVVGAWPLPVGVLIAILGVAGVRWDRAAAGGLRSRSFLSSSPCRWHQPA